MTQHFDSITAREIVLKHPKSNIQIRLMATEEGAGIWVGDDRFVAIHAIAGQFCLCVGKEDQAGHAFAISIDERGEPVLQVCRPGRRPVIISGQEIEDLVKEAKQV